MAPARVARLPPGWARRVLIVLAVAAALAAILFGLRSYHTFLLLRSAYESGAPDASSLRPWMTLGYVASSYGAPEPALRDRLGLPPEIGSATSLRSLADREGQPPLQYVQRVQRAIAAIAPARATGAEPETTKWLGAAGDGILSALLVYGYPTLALTLLLGAVGLPLPSGLSMVVAGSLAAQGRMDWALASALAVTASVLGDVIGYGLGRVFGRELLDRRARWVGVTPDRRARVERLVGRWGALSVLLSRSLVSFLSSAVNLVAGASRYPFAGFVAFAIAGRLVWTSAYLGLGYGASGGLDHAAGFLTNLSGFLIALALLAGVAVAAFRGSAQGR
jgi:membrane protein DedA with SNARE-associated domain